MTCKNINYDKKAEDYMNDDITEDNLKCLTLVIKNKREKIESLLSDDLNISKLNLTTKKIYIDNYYYVLFKSIIFVFLIYNFIYIIRN